jgi:hypothetical protein
MCHKVADCPSQPSNCCPAPNNAPYRLCGSTC